MATTNAIVQRTSQEVTRCIEQNDPSLTRIFIHLSTATCRGKGSSSTLLGNDIVVQNNSDFIRLGDIIGNNTYLERVAFCRCNRRVPGEDTTRKFIEGFKRSTSVKELYFPSLISFSHGLGCELMNFYENNNDRLENFFLEGCSMSYRGFVTLTNAIKACKKLKSIRIGNCYTNPHAFISDKCIGDIVTSIKGNYNLKALRLRGNNIGIQGCTEIAKLLSDSLSNLVEVSLAQNNIDNECVKILATALRNNKKLIALCLDRNINITRNGFDIFENLLCNTSSVNATYQSNHTLRFLENVGHSVSMKSEIRNLMTEFNKIRNKSVVSMIKILRHHRHISMEPFFAWELKVFPIAIKWFDSALARFPDVLNFHNNFDNNQKTIGKMKLSAIYEFARMLPMHFVPAPIVQTRNKRKHSMMTRSRRGNGV